MNKLFVGGSIFGILAFLTVVCLAIAGWVMNIVAIFHIANEPIAGMFIIRCIGVFVAPLGAILGWC